MSSPTILHADQYRRTTTPNATMTTLASPSLAGTDCLSLWRVELPAGGSGPLHAMSSEQIWTLLVGEARVTIEGEDSLLEPGDTVHLPGHALRRFTATTPATFLVCGLGDAIATTPENATGAVPPWIS